MIPFQLRNRIQMFLKYISGIKDNENTLRLQDQYQFLLYIYKVCCGEIINYLNCSPRAMSCYLILLHKNTSRYITKIFYASF